MMAEAEEKRNAKAAKAEDRANAQAAKAMMASAQKEQAQPEPKQPEATEAAQEGSDERLGCSSPRRARAAS